METYYYGHQSILIGLRRYDRHLHWPCNDTDLRVSPWLSISAELRRLRQMHIQKNEDQRSAGSKRRTGGHNRSLRSLPSSLTRPVNILSAGNKNIRLSIINCIDWVRPVRYTYTLQCRCIKILRYTLSLRRRHLVNIIANRNAVMNGRTSLALAETVGPVDATANRRSLSASVVVLDESPCPRGSPRTNLQALVLDSRVLLLVFVLGLQLSPWEFSRTVCVYETVNVWNGHVIGALTHWHWLAYTLIKVYTIVVNKKSAIAEGPRDAPCQLKPCEMSHKCSFNCIWLVLQQASEWP